MTRMLLSNKVLALTLIHCTTHLRVPSGPIYFLRLESTHGSSIVFVTTLLVVRKIAKLELRCDVHIIEFFVIFNPSSHSCAESND